MCRYKTILKTSIEVHIRKHTGDKPYKCGLCDYSSSQKANLDNHRMRKHPSEEYDFGDLIVDFGRRTSSSLFPAGGFSSSDTTKGFHETSLDHIAPKADFIKQENNTKLKSSAQRSKIRDSTKKNTKNEGKHGKSLACSLSSLEPSKNNVQDSCSKLVDKPVVSIARLSAKDLGLHLDAVAKNVNDSSYELAADKLFLSIASHSKDPVKNLNSSIGNVQDSSSNQMAGIPLISINSIISGNYKHKTSSSVVNDKILNFNYDVKNSTDSVDGSIHPKPKSNWYPLSKNERIQIHERDRNSVLGRKQSSSSMKNDLNANSDDQLRAIIMKGFRSKTSKNVIASGSSSTPNQSYVKPSVNSISFSKPVSTSSEKTVLLPNPYEISIPGSSGTNTKVYTGFNKPEYDGINAPGFIGATSYGHSYLPNDTANYRPTDTLLSSLKGSPRGIPHSIFDGA